MEKGHCRIQSALKRMIAIVLFICIIAGILPAANVARGYAASTYAETEDALYLNAVNNAVATVEAKTGKAATGEALFTDIGAKHWARDAIGVLKKDGIIDGYPDGSFKPQRTVTYGEFIKMAYGACTGRTVANSVKPGEHWAAGYYRAALAEGYFDDMVINEGMLAAPIPRKHMAHIAAGIIRAAEAKAENTKNNADLQEGTAFNSISLGSITLDGIVLGSTVVKATPELFTDISVISEKSYDIMTAANAGVLNGYEDGSFRPGKTLTRAEAATVIYRLWELAESINEETKEEAAETEDSYSNKPGTDTGNVIIRNVENKDGVVPVKYNVRSGQMSDMGIAKLEYVSENTIYIYSKVNHDFIFILLSDGSFLNPIGFTTGYSSQKDGYYVFAANPKGKDLSGESLYFMFEEGDTVYCFSDAVLGKPQ